MSNDIKHKRWKFFKTIITHKYWVFHYCRMCGLTYQGIIHDLSKFSPTEFNESAKYYTGDKSPIINCKEDIGYSEAWLHYRGRNKHHSEYWTDNYDKGTTTIKMPFKYLLEMICDNVSASRVYNGGNFNEEKLYEWWLKRRQTICIHKQTKAMCDIIFDKIYSDGVDTVLGDKKLLKSLETIYNEASNWKDEEKKVGKT